MKNVDAQFPETQSRLLPPKTPNCPEPDRFAPGDHRKAQSLRDQITSQVDAGQGPTQILMARNDEAGKRRRWWKSSQFTSLADLAGGRTAILRGTARFHLNGQGPGRPIPGPQPHRPREPKPPPRQRDESRGTPVDTRQPLNDESPVLMEAGAFRRPSS